MNLMDLSATQLAAEINAGHTTPLAAARAARARVDALNPTFNAITVLNPALEDEAAKVALRLAAGEVLPLAGVPVVIKDNIWVKGLTVTQGSRLFADFIAPEDAAAVASLRAAGALILGMGACSEFACKGVTNTPLHGKTRNPVDPSLTTGGSSGGPVAAVASKMAPLALGTDAGGSSRRPPAHTGLLGFKPTQDLVPYGPGFDEPVDGISVICPIARTVDDIALAMSVLAGTKDAVPFAGPMAYAADFGLGQSLDEDVAIAFAAAIDRLKRANSPLVAAAPQWGEFDGGSVMPLQFAGLARLFGKAWRETPHLFDPDLGAQIETGLGLTDGDVAAARDASAKMGVLLTDFLSRFDAVIVPTTPCTAWPVDQIAPREIGGVPCAPRDHAAFTPQANHAGCPAITIPLPTSRSGLPIGIQIIAGKGRDAQLIATAKNIMATLAQQQQERAL